MPPAQPPQQPQGDNSLAALWLTVLLFITCGLIWYFGHTYIVSFVYKIKLFQAEIISLFTSKLDPTIQQMRVQDLAQVTFQQMQQISTTIGDFVRYPIVIVLAILALLLYFNDVTTRYRRTYTMKSLAEAEQVNWPQIKPIVKLDLISQDIDNGPWAMAMTPMQFAKKYKLLQEEPIVLSDQTLRRKARPSVSVIRNKAKQIFTLQLGRYWESPNVLNDHTKALFAIFAARINRDREQANKLVSQIAVSVDSGKLNFAGVDDLLNKHKDSKHVIEITQRHAFLLTVMASMLETARNDGVIATADFLWLKPLDRSLWYMLNSIGRQTPYVEVAGPFAHWLAEKEFGRKIMVPMVDEAVTALEVAVQEIIYVPDEEEK